MDHIYGRKREQLQRKEVKHYCIGDIIQGIVMSDYRKDIINESENLTDTL